MKQRIKSQSFSSVMLLIFSAGLVAALDQLTKYIVLLNISVTDQIPIIDGFFNLVLTFNRGVAFGMLAETHETLRVVLLSISTVLAIAVLFYLFFKEYRSDSIARIAISLILGGALGNIIDRLRIGMVVDFLDFYLNLESGAYHWPAFNLADSAIFVGVFVLLFRRPGENGNNSENKGQDKSPQPAS